MELFARHFSKLLRFEQFVKRKFVFQKRGLMNDHEEWRRALKEAATFKMPRAMRQTFATMLSFGVVKQAPALWEEFKEEMIDRGRARDIGLRTARALHHIESILKHNGYSLATYELEGLLEELPTVSDDEPEAVEIPEARCMADEMEGQLNEEQRAAYKTLVEAATGKRRKKLYYLDGPGGCGKTFLYKALYYRLISLGKRVCKSLLINSDFSQSWWLIRESRPLFSSMGPRFTESSVFLWT